MGKPQQRTRNRQSTRQSIQAVLSGAERAFIDALSSALGIVKVEDVRQACLSIALSRAFQTSLGEDAGESTASAADILGQYTVDQLPLRILLTSSCCDGYHSASGNDRGHRPQIPKGRQ